MQVDLPADADEDGDEIGRRPRRVRPKEKAVQPQYETRAGA